MLSDNWVRVRGTIQVYDLAGTRILSRVDVCIEWLWLAGPSAR